MNGNAKIPKGYYIKARKIEQSDIAHAPPHVREIWDWLIRNANHKNQKCGNKIIKRGQCLTSYREILEGLHWMIGFRKQRYTKHQCEIAMKWLRKATMIATQKTTRGLIITIFNYDFYQNPKNYESHNEHYTKATTKPQGTDTINKNGKKEQKAITFSPNSSEFRLSKLLLDFILERKPNFRKPNLQKWCIHIDRLIRLDKRTPEQIEAVIRWCQEDDFWQNNILSTDKLRKQIDKLELGMEKDSNRETINPLEVGLDGLTPREHLRMKLEKEKQQEIKSTERIQEYADSAN